MRQIFVALFFVIISVMSLGCEFTWSPDGNCFPEEECAGDPDEDGIINRDDNCPDDYNPDQKDTSDDGIGDACPIDEVTPKDGATDEN